MSLAQLLAGISPAEFIEQYYLKLLYAQSGGCRDQIGLADWQAVERILGQPDADVLVVKSGAQRPAGETPSYAEARALHAEGWTIVLRHVERRDPAIANFAAGFTRDLLAPLDAHLYCTPASQFGFGWHYDAEDVFILQTSGRKEYSLRKNTVNPWPVLECMPDDMGFQHEIMPLVKCSLSAGDWLYIPGGYWHRAESREDSISLAIGVVSTTALDLLDFVRSRLPASLVWRQRLPIASPAAGVDAEQARQQYQELCDSLGHELAHVFSDPQTAQQFQAFQQQRYGSASGETAAPDSSTAGNGLKETKLAGASGR